MPSLSFASGLRTRASVFALAISGTVFALWIAAPLAGCGSQCDGEPTGPVCGASDVDETYCAHFGAEDPECAEVCGYGACYICEDGAWEIGMYIDCTASAPDAGTGPEADARTTPGADAGASPNPRSDPSSL